MPAEPQSSEASLDLTPGVAWTDSQLAVLRALMVQRLKHRSDLAAAALPEDVAGVLLRALTWCGSQITNEERELAWSWVDSRCGNVEEMGG